MVSAIILTVIFTLGGFILQVAVLPAFGLTSVGPNMIIAAMVPVALFLGPWAGMIVGFVGGLLLDIMTGWGLGINCLMLTILGFLVGVTREQVNAKNVIFALTIAIVCYIVQDLWAALALYFSRMTVHLNFMHMVRTVISAGLTGAVTILNYSIIQRSMDSISRRSPYFS